MRKEIAFHLAALILLFVIATLFKGWFELRFLLFWLGGLVGLVLPDADHLVYTLVSRPDELTSQRAANLLGQRRLRDTFILLYRTREERRELIFHTALFQLLFLVLAFFVISSTGSLFGRGLVLGFLVHLLVNQFGDLNTEGLGKWFRSMPLRLLDKQGQLLYWLTIAIITCILAVIL